MPPSNSYCSISVMVPAPPEPAEPVAKTVEPSQTEAVAGVAARVPDTGWGLTDQLTALGVEVLHPLAVAVR